jgi:cell division septum initiation protein DivIVA
MAVAVCRPTLLPGRIDASPRRATVHAAAASQSTRRAALAASALIRTAARRHPIVHEAHVCSFHPVDC